ncbi:MAG: hypothetical protein NVS1B11_21360 [Terriglobales bacterium]
MKHSKKKKVKPEGRVKLLPPTAEAARDEGPRLLPLGDPPKEPSRLEHYLDLADTALHLDTTESVSDEREENE